VSSNKKPSLQNDQWEQVISEATQHVETDGLDGGEAASSGQLRRIFLGFIITVSVAVFTLQLGEPELASLSVKNQSTDLRLEAALLIEQINAYWEERGTLPDPNALSPFLDEGYEYQIVDPTQGRFIVQRAAGGVTVTYDGSIPLNLWILLGGQTTGGDQ
jgi:hypothetical protein